MLELVDPATSERWSVSVKRDMDIFFEMWMALHRELEVRPGMRFEVSRETAQTMLKQSAPEADRLFSECLRQDISVPTSFFDVPIILVR